MGNRTRTEEDIIRRKLASYNVGLAMTLSRPVEGSHLHIASGFLLEEVPGERILVTAGHFIELVHNCLDLEIVEGICVHHQDHAIEQNLKQYILLECSPKTDPGGMRVSSPMMGKEILE